MSKRMKIVKSVDRISSLPDAVLHRILSFLPTKYAACTSILSTRWRYLFPFTHNLDFDDSLVLNPQKNDRRSDETSRFMNFVDRYIMLSNVAHIYKFRLKCHKNLDASRVNTWICAVLVRNVRELDLCIPNREKPGMLPCCVFTCSTLVVLKLDIDISLNVPASVYLPCLHSLHLHSIEFPDDISTQRLFSSCPALEDLVITRCSMKNIRVFKLSSPTLKRLTMDENYAGSRRNCKLALDAPRLIYLKYAGCNKKGSSLKNLHALYEADMYFYYVEDEHFELCFVLEVLKGINSVRSLCLSEYFGRELRSISAELPLFENMTHLKLSCEDYLDGFLLLKLLHCSPNLEELNVTLFEGCPDYGEHEHEFEDEANNNVPSCLSYHLKVVEFMSIGGDEEALESELRCVEYLMKNAGVLEMVKIHMNNYLRFHLKIAKKLLMIPRLSKTCKVEIDSMKARPC